jgi:predicted ArsR family transcriptional regulator
MKTSRQRLIEYLRLKQVASASEIGQALHMTAANARHHLSTLESEGIVEIVDYRRLGHGRPIQVYGLTLELGRHNLDGLANALLLEFLGGSSPAEKQAYLLRIAAHLHGESEETVGNLTQRFTHAVRHLNMMNYQARWEAHATSPRVILAHCPFADVLPEHPELCQLDAYLLERMLGLGVEQTAKRERNAQGGTHCIFKIR